MAHAHTVTQNMWHRSVVKWNFFLSFIFLCQIHSGFFSLPYFIYRSFISLFHFIVRETVFMNGARLIFTFEIERLSHPYQFNKHGWNVRRMLFCEIWFYSSFLFSSYQQLKQDRDECGSAQHLIFIFVF